LKVWPLPAAPAVTLNPYGAWPTTAKPTIREGYEGDVVRYLERVLVEKGGQVLAPDRYFRSDTTTAVKNLQRFFGLVVDGVVGSQTWPVIDMLAKK
jgi:peptidoglycan hydrolase-like protein with peptidoglycan-binding domain